MTAMQPSWTRSGSSPERPITMYESSSATASSHTAQPWFLAHVWVIGPAWAGDESPGTGVGDQEKRPGGFLRRSIAAQTAMRLAEPTNMTTKSFTRKST